MRLLFLAPSFPYPPRAGHELITYHHIKYLAQRHSVDLLAFDNSGGKIDTKELRACCQRIETVHLKPWRLRLNKCLGLAKGASLHAAHFQSPEMSKMVRRYLSDNSYDAAIFQTTLMAQFLPELFHGVTVLNMVDPLVLNLQRTLSWKPWFARPWARYKIQRLQQYELEHAKRFDRVLLISRADIFDYQDIITGARFDWVTYAVDAESPVQGLSQRREGNIVISGMMDHPPNVDAVEFFCRDVFPLIRREMASATLTIVGARPTASVRKWARVEHIVVTGSVPDIRPYLSEAMVSVCPVRLKVGTQTKVLEAMAMGTPVVSTSAGNHGVGGIPGEHLYVADTPDEFAKRVLALLQQKKHWKQLSTNGLRFVHENFTWKRSGEKLESILSEIVQETDSEVRCRAK